MPRSTPASTCSTPATSTAWATTSCSSARRCAAARARTTGSASSSAPSAGPTARGWASTRSPPAVKTALAYTLHRLGIDHIDVYRPARLDPDVPIEETIGAIAELVQAGYVRHIGLSEVGAQTHPPRGGGASDLRPADRVLAASRAGSRTRSCPRAASSGIGITAYGVLSRGLISGHWSRPTATLAAGDFRAHSPRFQGENLRAQPGRSSTRCARSPTARASPSPRWRSPGSLAQGEDIVPLVGARTRERLDEALGALDADARRRRPRRASSAPCRPSAAAGDRYPQAQMAMLDSERG